MYRFAATIAFGELSVEIWLISLVAEHFVTLTHFNL